MSLPLPALDNPEILPSELLPVLNSEPVPVRLVDCREEDEFAICRIEGAELIPLSRFGELAPTLLGNEERPVVIYCHHGMRSLQATGFLRQRGLEKVWSLSGGIERWSVEIDDSVPRY
ncbi:MAG: rhodanese-like domain-containing protein [Verrucomicrobiales bacterium]|nr:rhodanese-like domain-containing protein [Verrucomicrobiales bacterium]